MKKINFIRLLVLMMVLMTSINTALGTISQRIIFFQANDNWLASSAKPMIHYWQNSNSSNNGDVEMTLSNNDKLYYAYIPDWADRVQFYRKSGNSEWNRTGNLTVENWYGQGNINSDCSFNNWDNTVWWNNYTIYYDDYETGFTSGVSTPKLRVGTTANTTKDDMTKVTGTYSLYKHTKTGGNWEAYHAFCFANAAGATGSKSIYDRGSDEYNITKQTEYIRGSLKGNFTFIGHSAGSYYHNDDKCTYYSTEIYYGIKKYRITNNTTSNGTFVLTYTDEDGITHNVAEGESADVLPTTIVTASATPDAGYALTNVKLWDATGDNRDWLANGESSNQYIVRCNVTFEGQFEPKTTKTIVVNDEHGWGSMSIHAWNLFTGINTIDYPVKDYITVSDAGAGCNGTWYIINISNEYYYMELYKTNDIAANAGDVQTKKMVDGNKYYNTNKPDYDMYGSSCVLPDLYYVETYDGTNYYRSNTVTNTADTMSFYANLQNGSSYVKLRKFAGSTSGWTRSSDLKSSFSSTYTPSVNEPGNIFTARVNDGLNGLNHISVYDGTTYIRTDVASSWDDYQNDDDSLVVNPEYRTATNNLYSHYYMHWATTSQNVKFDLANQFNAHLTGRDEGFAADDYTNDAGSLAYNSNIRFMWNRYTNTLSRAYISGSSTASDRYLVLSCSDDKLKDKDGNALNISGLNPNEALFKDDGNWVYELDAKVYPGAQIKLTSDVIKLGGSRQTQYFKGTADSYVTLMSGSITEYQNVRIVYDFKTNHLVSSWVPNDGAISGDLTISTDVMLLRKHQGDAKQITFTESGITLGDVKTIFGVMQFNKWVLNNKSEADGHADLTGDAIKSAYWRDLYWISFPFSVNLSDVFGFGTYGTHWIMEYYDGKGRAKNGFWADSPSNWKFVTPAEKNSFVLEANVGYILALDLDELGTESAIWNNNVTDVYLYFPSTTTVGDLTQTTHTVEFTDQNLYECKIGPRFAGGDDRTKADSYWHCIGVPSFADNNAGVTDGSSTITWQSDPKKMPFLYQWDAYTYPNSNTANTLTAQNTSTFNFKSMYSYLVQYSGEEMHWSAVTNVPASVAARLTETPDREYSLSLVRESEEEDHALLRLTDDASVSNRFEFNYDLSKEYNAGRGNIWTVTADTVEVAGNSMPKPLQTTIVPVGVKVVANGEYTLAMPEGTNGEDVFLIDNAYGTRTNLGLMPYTVTLTAGTYEGRFVLEFAPIQDSPTSLENDGMSRSDELNDAIDGVRKVFVGGRLYIIRDGKAYDAAGQRIE